MDLIAVTGTNGKTSVASYIQQLLTASGRPTASYGSLGVVTPSWSDSDPKLPPDDQTLPALMQQLQDDVEFLVFGATSFALARGILDALTIRTAVFTNLSHDHLEVHGGSLSVYFGAKSRLFTELLPSEATAILGDDDASAVLTEHLRDRGFRPITIGPDGDLRLLDRQSVAGDRSLLELSVHGQAITIELPLQSDFQAINLLYALAVGLDLQLELDALLHAASDLVHPPGRFERIGAADGVALFVDHARNPHALSTVLASARTLTDGKVGVVLGCGGERDPTKRAPMGRIASSGADLVVVTDDNVRSEDAATIRREILAGCPRGIEVADRRQAIRVAWEQLNAGDVLVVAGRGDESWQEIGSERFPLDDREVLREIVEESRSG